MKRIAENIAETAITDGKFEKYENQLYRYFSELLIPYFFVIKKVCSIKEFHPKNTGINHKSCDCSIEINGIVVYTEITTISPINKDTLKLKIEEIFQEKAQKQTVKNPSLLAIDVTLSAQESFNKKKGRCEVVFPIFGDMMRYIGEELEKEENKHLMGVLIAINKLRERNGGDLEIIFDYNFKRNRNNSYYTIMDGCFNQIYYS